MKTGLNEFKSKIMMIQDAVGSHDSRFVFAEDKLDDLATCVQEKQKTIERIDAKLMQNDVTAASEFVKYELRL